VDERHAGSSDPSDPHTLGGGDPTPQPQAIHRCPRGHTVSGEVGFCSICGSSLAVSSSKPPPPIVSFVTGSIRRIVAAYGSAVERHRARTITLTAIVPLAVLVGIVLVAAGQSDTSGVEAREPAAAATSSSQAPPTPAQQCYFDVLGALASAQKATQTDNELYQHVLFTFGSESPKFRIFQNAYVAFQAQVFLHGRDAAWEAFYSKVSEECQTQYGQSD
jgi:hypothetical protein